MIIRVPNAVEGHDSPELEIYGMDGVPEEDIQRHYDGLPIVAYTKSKMIIGDASILPILAAQKVTVAAQLAESKNMTVQGDLGVTTGAGITSPPAIVNSSSAPIVSPVLSGGNTIISPPLPPSTSIASPPMPPTVPGAEYWNNPYYMAAYYQYQSQYPHPQAQNPQYAAAQYYQAYANYYQQATPINVSSDATIEPEPKVSSKISADNAEFSDNNNVSLEEITTGPFMIPSHVDPRTNKIVPGTIFTVSDLDRSLEELRAEMKRYRV